MTPWDTENLTAPHTLRELDIIDQPQPEMTEAEWIEAYVAHTLKTCGFTHFDDGQSVEAYALETARASYADPCYRADGPEACADSDMDYWGED